MGALQSDASFNLDDSLNEFSNSFSDEMTFEQKGAAIMAMLSPKKRDLLVRMLELEDAGLLPYPNYEDTNAGVYWEERELEIILDWLEHGGMGGLNSHVAMTLDDCLSEYVDERIREQSEARDKARNKSLLMASVPVAIVLALYFIF